MQEKTYIYIYILFSPNKSKYDINKNHIILNEQEVNKIGHSETEKLLKFLGIHIDETWSWKYHVEKTCNKLARANYIINKIKNSLPQSINQHTQH